jgi:hypothetical protein
VHEQGLRRGIKTQAQRYVMALLQDIFLSVIFLQLTVA